MKIAVIGPGAMGCLFATLFAEADNEVVLIDKDPKRAEMLTRSGISIEKDGVTRNNKISVTADYDAVSNAELVLICVKAYDTGSVAEHLKGRLSDKTVVLTLQNGIGNIETLSEELGKAKVLAGTTAQGANVHKHGYIVHAGEGRTQIGELNNEETERVHKIAELFREAGIETAITDNLYSVIWEKLIVNVGINALTAILHTPNGKLVEMEQTRRIMQLAVAEAVAVASANGIKLITDDPLRLVFEVARKTGANRSSMLQDVERGRRTEIEFINGAVVRQARRLSKPAPVNETLTALVNAQNSLI